MPSRRLQPSSSSCDVRARDSRRDQVQDGRQAPKKSSAFTIYDTESRSRSRLLGAKAAPIRGFTMRTASTCIHGDLKFRFWAWSSTSIAARLSLKSSKMETFLRVLGRYSTKSGKPTTRD